jgi:hypothetical protein
MKGRDIQVAKVKRADSRETTKVKALTRYLVSADAWLISGNMQGGSHRKLCGSWRRGP